MTPDGVSRLLGLDGDHLLSNAVHIGSGEILVGAAAWQRADTDASGFVFSPLRAADGPVHVAGEVVDPADLVAATLRRVAGEASELAGAAVEDVRMVVPAGWGPRRRTWWRRAVGKAGLGQVRLVEAPVAVADRLAGDGVDASAARWLVVDVGAGCEVSVVRRSAGAGFEVLSTLADADAGGDRIDRALIETAVGVGVDELPTEQRWSVLASVRVAKHFLAGQPAVTMPVPGKPPVVLDTAWVRRAAQPVFERVGTLAAEAVENADMTMSDVDAVYAVGAAMAVPGSAEMIAGKLGVTPQVPDQPGFVAVLGAAGAATVSASDAPPPTQAGAVPPLRRLVGLALPGVLSLALYAHFLFGADFYNGTPQTRTPFYHVLASWGQLSVAATLALLACLQAAALIGAVLYEGGGARASQRRVGAISTGIGGAVMAGVAVAGLYAVTAAVFFALPVSRLLRWSVAPLVPVVVCGAVLAVLAWRRQPPRGDWDGFLAFPLSSSVPAAVGIFGVAGWWHGHLPGWFVGWESVVGYVGGLLVGVALACTLARRLVLRIGLTLLLGFFCMIVSRSGPQILAVIYALAAATWWGQRAWALVRVGRAVPAR